MNEFCHITFSSYSLHYFVSFFIFQLRERELQKDWDTSILQLQYEAEVYIYEAEKENHQEFDPKTIFDAIIDDNYEKNNQIY